MVVVTMAVAGTAVAATVAEVTVVAAMVAVVVAAVAAVTTTNGVAGRQSARLTPSRTPQDRVPACALGAFGLLWLTISDPLTVHRD